MGEGVDLWTCERYPGAWAELGAEHRTFESDPWMMDALVAEEATVADMNRLAGRRFVTMAELGWVQA
jgi:hypothetical protein